MAVQNNKQFNKTIEKNSFDIFCVSKNTGDIFLARKNEKGELVTKSNYNSELTIPFDSNDYFNITIDDDNRKMLKKDCDLCGFAKEIISENYGISLENLFNEKIEKGRKNSVYDLFAFNPTNTEQLNEYLTSIKETWKTIANELKLYEKKAIKMISGEIIDNHKELNQLENRFSNILSRNGFSKILRAVDFYKKIDKTTKAELNCDFNTFKHRFDFECKERNADDILAEKICNIVSNEQDSEVLMNDVWNYRKNVPKPSEPNFWQKNIIYAREDIILGFILPIIQRVYHGIKGDVKIQDLSRVFPFTSSIADRKYTYETYQKARKIYLENVEIKKDINFKKIKLEQEKYEQNINKIYDKIKPLSNEIEKLKDSISNNEKVKEDKATKTELISKIIKLEKVYNEKIEIEKQRDEKILDTFISDKKSFDYILCKLKLEKKIKTEKIESHFKTEINIAKLDKKQDKIEKIKNNFESKDKLINKKYEAIKRSIRGLDKLYSKKEGLEEDLKKADKTTKKAIEKNILNVEKDISSQKSKIENLYKEFEKISVDLEVEENKTEKQTENKEKTEDKKTIENNNKDESEIKKTSENKVESSVVSKKDDANSKKDEMDEKDEIEEPYDENEEEILAQEKEFEKEAQRLSEKHVFENKQELNEKNASEKKYNNILTSLENIASSSSKILKEQSTSNTKETIDSAELIKNSLKNEYNKLDISKGNVENKAEKQNIKYSRNDYGQKIRDSIDNFKLNDLAKEVLKKISDKFDEIENNLEKIYNNIDLNIENKTEKSTENIFYDVKGDIDKVRGEYEFIVYFDEKNQPIPASENRTSNNYICIYGYVDPKNKKDHIEYCGKDYELTNQEKENIETIKKLAGENKISSTCKEFIDFGIKFPDKVEGYETSPKVETENKSENELTKTNIEKNELFENKNSNFEKMDQDKIQSINSKIEQYISDFKIKETENSMVETLSKGSISIKTLGVRTHEFFKKISDYGNNIEEFKPFDFDMTMQFDKGKPHLKCDIIVDTEGNKFSLESNNENTKMNKMTISTTKYEFSESIINNKTLETLFKNEKIGSDIGKTFEKCVDSLNLNSVEINCDDSKTKTKIIFDAEGNVDNFNDSKEFKDSKIFLNDKEISIKNVKKNDFVAVLSDELRKCCSDYEDSYYENGAEATPEQIRDTLDQLGDTVLGVETLPFSPDYYSNKDSDEDDEDSNISKA